MSRRGRPIAVIPNHDTGNHAPTAVWDYYCLRQQAQVGHQWLEPIDRYESSVLVRRG